MGLRVKAGMAYREVCGLCVETCVDHSFIPSKNQAVGA